MSNLGSITGYLGREQTLLRDINSALMTLEAEALGQVADFGFSREDLSRSKQTLTDFISRLRAALEENAVSRTEIDLQSLVFRIKSGYKAHEDWKEDLDRLLSQLQTTGQVDEEMLRVLEDILSLLDSEFVEDLRRLYTH